MTDLSMNWIAQPALGDTIRASRKAKGMSQGGLAEAVMRLSGFDLNDRMRRNAVQVQLSTLEHGNRGKKRAARSQYLPAIERALGINLHESPEVNGAISPVQPPAPQADPPAPGSDKPFEAALKSLYSLRLDSPEALDGVHGAELRCAVRLIQLCHDIADEWNP